MNSLLLPYQKRWIADESRVKIYEKSRRIGISWAEACDAVMTAAAARGSNVYYISYNKEMTRQFVEDCAFWARALHEAASAVQEEILKDGERSIQVYQINFGGSGRHIQALSGSPRNLRSKQGVLIIDEAAFVDDIAGVIKAGLAFLIWGGRVRIISTHNGVENPFNELVQDARAGRKPFSVHRTTLDDALADGLYRRICEKNGQPWSQEAESAWRREMIEFYRDDFEEELFCVPSRSGGRYLPLSTIEAAEDPGVPVLRWACPDDFAALGARIREDAAQEFCQERLAPLLAGLPNLPTFFGQDFGRSGDLTVIWPAQRRQDLALATPFLLELRNVPYEQQRQVLFYLVDRLPSFWHGALDARGNGEYLAEVAMQRYGASRISQVKANPGWYQETMPKFKAALEDRGLNVPRDADVRNDLRAVTVIDGIPRIPEGRARERTQDGRITPHLRHGDAAVAGAMLVYASRQESGGPVWAAGGAPRAARELLARYGAERPWRNYR